MAVVSSSASMGMISFQSFPPFRLLSSPSSFSSPSAEVKPTLFVRPLSFKALNYHSKSRTNNSMGIIPSRLNPRASASSSTLAELSNASEILADVEIFRASGEPVKFKELWDQEEGVAVVALMRHFGCICCWEYAMALKEAIPTFESAGVKLIAVGVGTPNKAQILAEKLPFPLEYLYADSTHKAYDLLGLYFGLGRTFFNPASTKVFSRFDSLKKAAENYTIKATPDDRSSVLQQGGMFVFKGKQLLYARKEEGTGDHAPLDDIFDVCCKVPAGST